jgi:hypothetical protein
VSGGTRVGSIAWIIAVLGWYLVGTSAIGGPLALMVLLAYLRQARAREYEYR